MAERGGLIEYATKRPLRYPGLVATALWLDDLELRAWRSLLRAHARLLARLDAELQASKGMSVNDYGVLVQLSEEEGGSMRMSELAERLLLSPSGLTRRLDGLVRAGLVERVGNSLQLRAREAVDEVTAYLFDVIGSDGLETAVA